MSEDKKLTPEQAFEKWLDHSDSLERSSKESFEDLLTQRQNQQAQSNVNTDEDAIWQQRLKTARTLEHQVSLQAEHNVPDWHRSAAFESDAFESNRRPWWQWGGLPAMSMAFSAFALA
jgi:hypothetical protein